MSAFTDFAENKIIDTIFRNRQWAVPTTIFVELYTAAPGETGGGTAVTGGSYASVQQGPSDSTWKSTQGTTSAVASSGTGGQTSNGSIITFATPTANWGVVSHVGLKDASGGNLLIYGALTTPKTVNNGDPAPTFPVDAFTFTVA